MPGFLIGFPIALCLAPLLALALWGVSDKRVAMPWLLLFLALVVLDETGLYLALHFHLNHALGLYWNWVGKAFSLAWVVLFLAWGPISFREAGFRRPRPGTIGKSAALACAFLLACLVVDKIQAPAGHASIETLLFQASMPTLAEESVYRGVLFAILMRAFGEHDLALPWYRSRSVWITALAFGLIHGVSIGHGVFQFNALACLFPLAFGLVAGGLRKHTDSLWPAIALHGAVDFGAYAVSLV